MTSLKVGRGPFELPISSQNSVFFPPSLLLLLLFIVPLSSILSSDVDMLHFRLCSHYRFSRSSAQVSEVEGILGLVGREMGEATFLLSCGR